MKKLFIFVSISILFSCTSSKSTLTTNNQLISKEKAYSSHSNISANIPLDWFVAEDNDCNCTDLWFVNNDYSSSVLFRKMNFKIPVENSLQQLKQALFYNKQFAKSKPGNNSIHFFDEESFSINGITIESYSYANTDGQLIRTLVFYYKNQFYESIAISHENNSKELVEIQNAVISSIN